MTQSLVLSLITFLLPLASIAGSYEEAQAELAAAYNDYYRALKDKPGFTNTDAQELAKQILAPANAKVAKAMEDDSKNARKRAADNDIAKSLGMGSTPKPNPRKPATITVETPSPAKPEVVLDGSNIPKEVEFPGRKRK